MVALVLSVLAMAVIVGLRYLAVSGAFAWVTNRRIPGFYNSRGAQIRREIGWSLASSLIYAAPAGVLAWGWQAHGWTRIYSNVAEYPLWWLPASLIVYLFLHDSWFYWTHRAMHWPPIYKRVHAVHHASREPTAWAAMSFHPWESVTGAILVPALVLLIPIHSIVLLLVLLVMTIMGVTNHMGWELFPRWLVRGTAGRWLITASHHQRHHEKHLCNFGLYFRVWDRLCGTDRGLAEFSGDRSRPLRQN